MFAAEELTRDPLVAGLARGGGRAPSVGGVLLRRKLGEGGAGSVYLGLHTRLDLPVAVKVLKSTDTEDLSAFEREARITASLDHPNLVRVFDFNCETGLDGAPVYYIIMEYVEGRNAYELLDARLKQARRPLDAVPALEVVLACAQALGTAHERGIVHRDIKPENILIRARDGVVKVADLGLARRYPRPGAATRALGGAARGSGPVGTRGFMAPEALEGEPLDPSADVYSLGVTLYELLTARLPFGSLDHDYTARQKRGAVDDPRKHVLDLDPEVAALALRCLARDPAARPRDGAALAAEIEAILGPLEREDARAAAAPRAPAPAAAPAAAVPDVFPALAPTPRPAPVSAASPPVVLCVDDDEISLDLLAHVLEKSGFKPAAYTDGAAALADLARLDPDVAVLDLLMPGLDGLELSRRLRAVEGFEDLPILIFSGLDAKERVAQAQALGLADYLVKPFDVGEVAVRVGLLARLRALERDRRRIEREYRARKGALPTPPITSVRPAAETLPMMPAPPASLAPAAGPRPLAGGDARREALVVDDDDVYRAIVARALGAAGFTVTEAADGVEALAAVAKRRPDVLILDLQMPRLGGLEVCRRLRAGHLAPAVPILVVTATVDAGTVREAFAAGATDYLTKPVDPTQLRCRVEAALHGAASLAAFDALRQCVAQLDEGPDR